MFLFFAFHSSFTIFWYLVHLVSLVSQVCQKQTLWYYNELQSELLTFWYNDELSSYKTAENKWKPKKRLRDASWFETGVCYSLYLALNAVVLSSARICRSNTVRKEYQTNCSSLEYEIINNFIPIQATRDRSAHHNVPVFRLARALGGARSHLVWMQR